MKVAVVGAGISGLTVAYLLQKKGFHVTLFEKENRVGGSIITEKENGFLIDTGPNSTLDTSPLIRQLINDLELSDRQCYASEISNNRYILKGGKLHALPMSPGKFLKSKLFSAGTKLRLMKEPFIAPTNKEDVSLAEFVRHRLGEEFLDYAINPFVAGVYAGNPEKLSTAAAFPKLFALEQNYGSILKGAIKGAKERKKRQDVSKDRAKLFSFLEGMSELTDTLAKKIENLYLSQSVELMHSHASGYEIEIREDNAYRMEVFKKVIITNPADVISNLLKEIAPSEASIVNEIEYAPVAVVYTGFKQEQVQRNLDGFGFLVPEIEKQNILGSIWSSSIFPQRSPEDFVAFTTFVGGTRQPELVEKEDREIKNIVLKSLANIVGVTGHPVITRIRRWPRAIPQYNLGYKKFQDIFDGLETRLPGLYFTGNFRKGISVGDCIKSAFDTVDKIINH